MSKELYGIGKNTHIMVVDDESVNLDTIGTIFRQLGFENVSKASNGKEALEFSKKKPVNLFFLDINMPEMGGFEVLFQLKQEKSPAKVIITSSESTVDNVKEALAKGANGFLAKPYSAANIINSLKHLQKQQKQQKK